jgi:peptide/nickel transport system substrate-binding protein
LDPQSQAIVNTDQLLRQIYEPLIARNATMQLTPALALSWEAVEPKRWRIKLRPGVRFHDGTPFTAEDAAFSLHRAGEPSSNYKNYTDIFARIEVVDPLTLDIVTVEPDPIIPEKLSKIAILSKAWCTAHGALAPATMGKDEFAALNVNGTGPFKLQDRRPNVRTTLVKNDDWWGTMDGNVTEYVSTPLVTAATRVAALLSGQVDVVLDPPLQDIARIESNAGTKVVTGPENRTILLVIDQGRPQLLYSNVKDKNPFQDIRVRKALYEAIDAKALVSRIMRGYAIPAGLQMPPGVSGYDKELDERFPYDRADAKKLLTEAGYPDGFAFTLDCSNNRYQNDEAVCQAVVTMWAAIGVKATLNAMPLQTYFPKVSAKDTDMYLLGIGSPTFDAYYSIQSNLLTRTGNPADGLWALGYNNDRVNALAADAKFQIDPKKRAAEMHEALAIAKNDIANIPLYHSVGAWAMASNVEATYRADSVLEARYVTLK